MIDTDRFDKVEVRSVAELHAWLLGHHEQQDAVWLVTYKKVVPARYITTDGVLDELVAFGWIDGIRRKLDDERTMQLISPRRTKPWAGTYRDRADRLIAERRMQPAGQRSIDLAKESGAWDELSHVDALECPQDLADALAEYPYAQRTYDAFPPSTKRNILRWIAMAKTAPTRSKRIALTVQAAQEGKAVASNG
jgi:uncharacterized protein YdeI (YjbR/CyaY-like superfamily)